MAWLIRSTKPRGTYYKIGDRRDGKLITFPLGYVTERKARTLLTRYESAQDLGLDPVAAPTPSARPSAIPTLRAWWGDVADPWPTWPACRMRDYVDARGYAPKTRRVWDSTRRQLLPLVVEVGPTRRRRELGDLQLDEVTPGVYDAVVAALRAADMRSRTIQIRTDQLRTSLRLAAEDGIVPAVVLRRVSVGRADRRAPRWLTPEETARMLAALERLVAAGVVPPSSALAIRTAEALFLRPGEALTRRWAHLDLEARSLQVCAVDLDDGTRWNPKADSARTLRVPPLLLAALREEWLRQGRPADGWLFVNRSGARLCAFRRSLTHACAAAGVRHLHPHALRHTGATRWAIRGAPRRALMEAGGWATGAMLDEVYEHATAGQVAALSDALEVAAATPAELPQDDGGGGDS